MDESDFQCILCLELPPTQAQQCPNGHIYCLDCWRKMHEAVLSARVCGHCRSELPEMNRALAAERAIAAFPATCGACGERMTRGELATHESACRARERQRREQHEREQQAALAT